MKEKLEKKTSVENTEQIFVFNLSGEEYAVKVENVDEIIRADQKEFTNVPNVPDFIKGIINVRGQVVPIMDLESKFNLKETEKQFIVIVEIEDSSIGIIVENVQEVVRIKNSNFKEAPEVLEEKINADYIRNVAVLDDRMIIILSIQEGLSNQAEINVDQMNSEPDEEPEDNEEEVTQEEVEEMAEERVEDRENDSDEEHSEDGENEEEREEFKCSTCGDVFDSKRGLASHRTQKH